MSRNDNQYKDFAVLMRVNALSRSIEQEFMRYGIPYKIYGGFKFYERKEIKDVLSYLKIANNYLDDESFVRAIATPKRGIGEKTIKELREYCTKNYISLRQGLSLLNEGIFSSSTTKKLLNFRTLIESIEEFSKNNSITQIIQFVLDSTCFLDQFSEKNEENISRLMNIDELKNSAEMFEKDNPYMTLSDYLNSITLSSDTDDLGGDNVTIATIHAVKGLEFKCVFIVGAEQEILPLIRANEKGEPLIEEERRLMYVAITRAMERLYLTWVGSRYLHGSRRPMLQSQFIKEGATALGITPPKPREYQPRYSLYGGGDERDISDSGSGYSSAYAKTMLSQPTPKVQASTNNSAYKSGMRVKHPKFGEGIVITVKGSDANIIVDVAFKGVGVKSLSAKYAPMEIL